ncbi:unnamed protein product [Mytilus coruscus]|uniref:MEGF10_11 n=1 Tax=Mytilus coruscus TaxID=42192 RepID=A0A6J8CPB1_MYTCO|nr:unnamed protein product [Mytilus coruscus]
MNFTNSTNYKIKVELRYDSRGPIGTYGIDCTGKCLYAQNAKCDSVTGDCVCPAGWNLFVVVVTITVSFICVLLLVLTYLLLWRYLKHRHNRSSHDDVVETRSVQGHFNESNYYSDILDDQLQDIRGTSSGMIENDNLQYRFQRTTNREHGYQNIAQSLSNIHLFEEEYYNSYCSLQHENEDYLNPYCALRFERRVHSSFF